MEQVGIMTNFRRRQSRQMQLEEIVKYGVLGKDRRHSEYRGVAKTLVLPPIVGKRRQSVHSNSFAAKVRARCAAETLLPEVEEESEPNINSQRAIKLPKIPTLRKNSVTNEDGHWNLPIRRVSQQNDKVIVHHLRYKLLKQHERRSINYKDEVNILREENKSAASGESFDEETAMWLQSLRSRGPSLSTINFSSAAPSRQDKRRSNDGSILLHRESAISVESQNALTSNYEPNANEIVGERFAFHPPPFISRPSICISLDTGYADWQEGHSDLKINGTIIEEETIENPSYLQKSMNESDRSASLLLKRARSRSILMEIPESDKKKIHSRTQRSLSKTPLNGLISYTDYRYHPEEQETQTSHSEITDPDRVDPDLPIGNITLFADWETQMGSPNRSRIGSFMSDIMTEGIAIGKATCPSAFIAESFPSSACVTSASNQHIINSSEDNHDVFHKSDKDVNNEFFDVINNEDDLTPEASRSVMTRIVLGDITVPASALQKRKVCIYLCSSGPDTHIERSYLHDTLTSRLRHFCSERNLSLEFIDLNYLPTELQTYPLEFYPSSLVCDNNHSTLQLRSSLIKKCFSSSLGPCFMTFLGDTTGSETLLPRAISISVFEGIVQHIEKQINVIETQIKDLRVSADTQAEMQTPKASTPQEPLNGIVNNRNLKLSNKDPMTWSKLSSLQGSIISGAKLKNNIEESTNYFQSINLEEKLQRLKNQDMLFRKWYSLNSYTQPASYTLKDISNEYSIYASTQVSATEVDSWRSERQQWCQVKNELNKVLNSFLEQKNCARSSKEKLVNFTKTPFFQRPIEAEIALATSAPVVRTGESCYWFRRILSEYDHILKDEMLSNFVEIKPTPHKIEQNDFAKVPDLTKQIIEKFGYSNIREYPLEWKDVEEAYSTSGQRNTSRTWPMHLERLRMDFYNVVTMQIENAMKKYEIKEIQEHAKFAQSLSQSFVGQEDILNWIKTYLRSPKQKKPFVLYGEVGSGKSSIMSKAATMTSKWMQTRTKRLNLSSPDDEKSLTCRIIYRSVGLTADSTHPRCLLSSICAQLRIMVDEIEEEPPSIVNQTINEALIHTNGKTLRYDKIPDLDFRSLSVKFSNLIARCGFRDCPLVIFVDNLDGLCDEHNAKNLKWIPSKLPKFVKLIVSVQKDGANDSQAILTTSSEQREVPKQKSCFEILKNILDLEEDSFNKQTFNIACIQTLERNEFGFKSNIDTTDETSTSFTEVMEGILRNEGQSLTSEQIQAVTEKCHLYSYPLSAVICARLASNYISPATLTDWVDHLPNQANTIDSFVHCMFRSLEEKYGYPLTASVSCFLTSSLHGLTSSELKSLLAYDQNVSGWILKLLDRNAPSVDGKSTRSNHRNLTKINEERKIKTTTKSKEQNGSQPIAKEKLLVSTAPELMSRKRIPDVLWQRFFEDFSFHLLETLSDGLLTLRWKHKILEFVCIKRYMPLKDNQLYYHHMMACYFSNQVPVKLTKSSQKNSSMDKVLAPTSHSEDLCQPLSWKVKTLKTIKEVSAENQNSAYGEDYNSSTAAVYNLRRLNESSYHYLQCRSIEQIKNEMLCNYEWLLAKIRSSSYEALLETVSAVLGLYRSDQDLRLLAETLFLSRRILKEDPCQLAAQLVGHMHHILKKDKPLARMDPRKYPFCRRLIAQSRRSSLPVLIPSGTCLTSPGDIFFDLHLGHRDVINAMGMSTDGHRVATSSRDETLKVWDVISGRVVFSVEGMPRHATSLCFCMGNNYVALLDRNNQVHIICLRKKEKLISLKEAADQSMILSAAGDGLSLLVLFCDQAKRIQVWDLEKFRLLHKINITPDHIVLRNDQRLVAGKNSSGFNIVYSFHASNEAYVYNVKRAKHLHTLKLQNEKGFTLITHVEVSREYYIIACKRQYMLLHEIVTFELYDAINYGHVRAFKACPEDSIFDVFVNRLGSHIIALSRGTTGTEIAVWNVESGSHQHMASQKVHSTQGCCVELPCCLTASNKETTLRVHNLAANIDEKTLSKTQTKSKALGIGEFYPISSNSRYVVARGVDNGPITVWNITRGRCKGEAVSIERGLLEKNDVIVVKDTKVIILSDRGLLSSELVFKTIYIYDLRTKKYTKKLQPVAITVCPNHEYFILGMDKLLAVSQDRGHFVIWSLVDGELLSKIYLDFSKYELAEKSAKGKQKEIRRKLQRQKTRLNLVAKVMPKSRDYSDYHPTVEERNRRIDQVLLSGDESTLLCSFYSRHVAVFDIERQMHTHTLTNEHSLLLLHQAEITYRGCHLVHTNYDDDAKLSYITVWSLQKGTVLRRLKNEPSVCALATTENASRIVFATEDNYLKIWDPFKRGSHRKISGYDGLRMRKHSTGCQETTVYITKSAKKAILFTYDISLWDLDAECVLARFTPDMPFQCCTVAMNGNLIVVGMRDTPKVITLRLMSSEHDVRQYGRAVLGAESGMFGEVNEKDSESSEDESSSDES